MINPIIVPLPSLGEDFDNFEIVKIFCKEGDYIDDDTKPFLDVKKENYIIEIPYGFKGRILKILIQEGQEVTVGTPLCVLSSDTLSHINKSLKILTKEFEVLNELQDFYYKLIELLEIPCESTPQDILNTLKNKIS